MGRKASMEFIANKLGVSKNTVSLAMRGMPGVSDATRANIFETARECGYIYEKESRNLTKDEVSRSICLILPNSIKNLVEFFGHIQYGIEDEAKKNLLNTIIYYYEEDGKSFDIPVCIKNGMISGIITLGRISTYTMDQIFELKLPIVMVDHYIENVDIDCVLTDNLCGGYIATEYLISQGHRSIGFIGSIDLSVSYYDRYQGFCKAMRHHGLPVDPSKCITDKSMESLAEQDMQLVVQELTKISNLPVAVFCCNDTEAITVSKALSSMGIGIPDRVSVMGFDNVGSSKTIFPELSTMQVEKELLGQEAVKRLMEILEGKCNGHKKILIPASLVRRQSVKEMKVT